MNEKKQVRGNKVRRLKTRCYYTDYVNHAIRFYLSCPDTLQTAGKRKADLLNWMAVQSVFYRLKDDDKAMLKEIYLGHYRVTEGVRMYCDKRGYEKGSNEENAIWIKITKVSAYIAKQRGLV